MAGFLYRLSIVGILLGVPTAGVIPAQAKAEDFPDPDMPESITISATIKLPRPPQERL